MKRRILALSLSILAASTLGIQAAQARSLSNDSAQVEAKTATWVAQDGAERSLNTVAQDGAERSLNTVAQDGAERSLNTVAQDGADRQLNGAA